MEKLELLRQYAGREFWAVWLLFGSMLVAGCIALIPPASLTRTARCIDRLNQWVGNFVAWTTFLVVLVVFVDVVMRYAFNTSFVFTQELEWHLFAFIFLMGAGYTLLKDGHVRVDIFYQRVGPKAKAWINLIGVIFFLLPGSFMIVETSSKFVYNAWAVMEGSADPGGIPYRFVLKSCIPLGFVLISLQGVSLGIRSLLTLLGRPTLETAERGEGGE